MRAALLVSGLLASFAAFGQPALKMMIPANPGGGWDQTGRQLATAMQSDKLVSGVQYKKGPAAIRYSTSPRVTSASERPSRSPLSPRRR